MKTSYIRYITTGLLGLISHGVFAATNTLPTAPVAPGPASIDYKIVEQLLSSDDEMMLSSFNADPKFHATRLQRAFFSDISDNFSGEFLIVNSTSKSRHYEIFCLINYRQKKYETNNEWVFSKKVTLKAKSHILLPMKLKTLKKGAYDFIVVAVRTDTEKLIEPDSLNRMNTSYAQFSHRANIYVAAGAFPKTSFLNNVNNKISNKYTFNQISLNNSVEANNFGALRSKQKNKINLDYYIHVSNQHQITMNYALIAFMDDKQIKVSDQDYVLFYKQDKQSAGSFSISKHKDNNTEKLWVISIENPYSILETTNTQLTTIPVMLRVSNILEFN